MHNTNSLLKYVAIPVLVIVAIVLVSSWFHHDKPTVSHQKTTKIKDIASNDSAAESLDTLTADLSKTKQKIMEVSKDNEAYKKQNAQLLNQTTSKHSEESSKLSQEIDQLKNQIQNMTQKTDSSDTPASSSPQSIAVVDDLTQPPKNHPIMNILNNSSNEFTTSNHAEHSKPEPIPYYTIPANGTSIRDKLMTALVGRIPVKGIVTDPYPFKIVISDDNLAANGLRVPHLLQMIVSGYCEGDLNLGSVRGWITSLTFVFNDGTISSTTSNDNDIGNYTKSNSLGYLSDKFGNPFINGKLITNAPAYLAGTVAIDAGVGAANAYTQSQTTNSNTLLGTTTTAVTGSQGKYVAGQAISNSANGVQKWWHDREEQSFDAIYVAPVDAKGNFVEIAVNFAKEIHIDYDPKGRKLNYAHNNDAHVSDRLD